MEEIEKRIGDIAPYTDEEALYAIQQLAHHRYIRLISKYLFPEEPSDYMKNLLLQLKDVDDFQQTVMSRAVSWVIENKTDGFTYEGVEYLEDFGDKKFLAMSNHRDIVLDPAFTQYLLFSNGIPLTEIAVGDNLLSSKTVEYMLRCNRMIKVIRGISARELYLSSLALSKYIRQTITSGKSSVWIAQRQGRTKDGMDVTEQGLLKMFDMSGEGSFMDNFSELNIVPLSISYEYEPCDVRKAREIYISRREKYVKKRNEDMHSIIMGIRQQKGRVHLAVGRPLATTEIEAASLCDKNDRYQWIRHVVTRRIVEEYKLWPNNYLSYDMVYKTTKYADKYTQEDVEKFLKYMDHRLSKVEKSIDREELTEIFLKIYSNPVLSKEQLFSDSL